MSTPDLRPPITTEHFATFGQIIVAYAACEITLKAILADMLGADQWAVHVLTDRMTSTTLLAKLKAVNAHTPDRPHRERIGDFIERLEKVAALRNEIAHGSWGPSQRPGGIRPVGMSVKAKGVKVIGFSDGEKDYSLEDLGAAAESLRVLGFDMYVFRKSTGQV